MSSSPTLGVRTWRRTGADRSAPLDARVAETTRPGDMAAALAAADFVTIPREGPHGPGYGDDYARAFGAALADRFAYAGARRVSASGRSHVFEREGAPLGAPVDLGVPESAPDAGGAPGAAQAPRTPSGDGALGRPPLAVR